MGVLKKIKGIVLLLIVCSGSIQAQEGWQWMHSIGGQEGQDIYQEQDEINDMHVDKWGNTYIGGDFYNQIYIQDTVLYSPQLISGNRDATGGFICKLDCNGELAWASRWGSANGGRVFHVLPFKDDVIVFGHTGTNQGYDSYIGDSIFMTGQWSYYSNIIARYSGDGELLWATDDTDGGVSYKAVNIDLEGNIYAVGNSNGDSNTYQDISLSDGIFFLKLDSNANYITHNMLTDSLLFPTFNSINFIELDDIGNMYIGGILDSAQHAFSGVPIDYGMGRSVAFLAKYDADFNLQWLEQSENLGNTASTMTESVVIDDVLNCYAAHTANNYSIVGGEYRGVSFQGDTIDNYHGNLQSSYKFVINKYDESGNMLWLKQVNSYRRDQNSKMGMYVSNDTIVSFGLIGAGAFNIDNFDTVLAETSFMLLQLDTNGIMLDISFFPTVSSGYYIPYGAVLSSSNNVHIAGMHSNYIEFPDSTLYPRNGSGSNRDIFIAKYGTSSCFHCDSIAINFSVEQDMGYTAVVSSQETLWAEEYYWDFGNGATSTDSLPQPSIVYSDTGVYTVCLTATSYCDSQTLCQDIHISCPPPLAQDYSYATGNNNIVIQSMDVAQNDSYYWDFGDEATSTDSLPTHQYLESGDYEVCLFAMNSCGVDSFCQAVTIDCPAPVIVDWEVEIDTTSLRSTLFNVVNYDSVGWVYGDGGTSTEEMPVYSYSAEGMYEVCMTAYNSCGATSICEEISVVGTGILQLGDGSQLSVYPNPAEDVLNIRVKNKQSDYQLLMIDNMGKRVLKDKLDKDENQINIGHLSQGIYYLVFSYKNQKYSVAVIKR
ncbi:MAG: PKD domain-containing protein [Chitinophagales bacterium]